MIMKFSTSAATVASTALAVILLAGVTQPASAQQQQPPRNGWFKLCTKQEDVDFCNVQFQSVASNGQLVTAVSLMEAKGKENRKGLQVIVPPGRLIPAGIKVKVDDGKEVTLPYYVCLPDRCIAEVPLDDAIVTTFKGGGKLTLTSTNFQNKPNPVEVTLEGFTAAFDGPPLKQDELEARQRQLQEELRKKAEERRKKLQEAQESAKSNATSDTAPAQ
ncbi:MAG: invasion associated locus B family protein [Nitratireductor sp.]|nr:invasion associated locus B family protein [Nitratireductor sp.]